ncbi:VanZ family protein [Luteolibacter ambystomatis]|uniref:VanZ family protein n=1 Tax=Luteolibacter ambystomatis TaxID=2824561 RepID=A0A975G669_9BACT|nr:VanZ family protein [Luteolibacter ambystomatis]QUE49496.1 VanZ family protein [Luteolibacter ambystomatis]
MRLPRHPAFWLTAWLVWFGTLWWLSSAPREIPGTRDITNFDKACHFGYFFGGAGLFAAFLYRLRPAKPDWSTLLALCMVAGMVVGRMDEWHQTHVPNRSGDDINDFLADMTGTLCGVLVFRRMHRMVE